MIIVLCIILTTFWFAATVAVDFLAIPAVFRTIPDVMLAGEVGMKVFSRFNYIELICATGLLLLAWFSPKGSKKILLIVSILLIFIASFYTFYLTPKIIELTRLMNHAHQGVITGLEDFNKEHESYHNFYVKMDSVKLFILLGLDVFLVMKKDKV